MLVVPGWPACSVDGSFAGPQQRGLRLALARGPLAGGLGGAHGGIQPVQGLSTAATGWGEEDAPLTSVGKDTHAWCVRAGSWRILCCMVRDAMEEHSPTAALPALTFL